MSGKIIDELYNELEKKFIDKKDELKKDKPKRNHLDYFYEIKKFITDILESYEVKLKKYFITTEKHPRFPKIEIDVYILTNTTLFNFSIGKDSYTISSLRLKDFSSPFIKVNKDGVNVELLFSFGQAVLFRDKKENMKKIRDFVALIDSLSEVK